MAAAAAASWTAAKLPWTPLYSQLDGGEETWDDDEGTLYYTYALAGTVAFTVLMYSIESMLDGRQRAAYFIKEFPKQLEVTVAQIDKETAAKRAAAKQQGEEKKEETTTTKKEDDDDKTTSSADDKKKTDKSKPLLPQMQDKFHNSQLYGLDKMNFGMIASLYDTLESICFLLLGFQPWAWDVSVAVGAAYFGWENERDYEIRISLIFFAIVTLVGTATSLPFELYSTFEIEKKHGFNKQTIGLFVSDKIKSLALTFLIGSPFLALLLWIIQKGGDYFYLYVWAFMFCFSVIMMTIVPVFIMPLFNKYEPLPDGPLKTRIYALADSLKYPLTKLFVMDGSKRSSHSNAFMFGFGNNKRIVLFDTLLEQVDHDEILAILGHELGHWALGHTWINFIVTQVYFGAAFYFFALTYTAVDLHAAFGFTRYTPTIVALLLFFQTLWAPVDKVLSFILTFVSRHHEFQADEFSVNLNMSNKLQSGLCKISVENLSAMCPDPWYSAYHYSHPPLVERLSAMMALDKKQKKNI